jgi:F0F1-type ATP synthase membrane subunit a
MYAGQILMIIIFGFVAFLLPALWLTMSLFVGVLQAIVFASLVASYYMLATSDVEESEATQH